MNSHAGSWTSWQMCPGSSIPWLAPASSADSGQLISPYNGTLELQVFATITNLSMNLAAAALHGAIDRLLLSVAVVPRVAGTPPFAQEPVNAAALFINGQAASGMVAIYDTGLFSANISIVNGEGSTVADFPQQLHCFGALYSGSRQFPESFASGSVVLYANGPPQTSRSCKAAAMQGTLAVSSLFPAFPLMPAIQPPMV